MVHLPVLRRSAAGAVGALLHDEWAAAFPDPAPTPAGTRRARIWDIAPNLHCSVIGTCLSTGELRQFFVKLGDADARTASDHLLHGRAVQLAGQRGTTGKLLHKTLDRRHDTAVRRFAKAGTAGEVRRLWLQSFEQGDIPGAYWAVLTHPATDVVLAQEVFGEVHMLSHMVGSSNRLDIARLRRAEQGLAERDDTISRQQARLKRAAEERDALLRRLETLEGLAARARRERSMAPLPAPFPAEDADTLRRKLNDEKAHAGVLAARLAEAEEALRSAGHCIAALEAREKTLQAELAAFEAELADDGACGRGCGEDANPGDLAGRRLLYVGGRPGLIGALRTVTARRGGTMLAHDGGIEDSTALLPGLISQADIAFFPVDCVSHAAAGRIKTLCRQAGKPFIPLRSASIATFIAAIAAPPIEVEVP
ncbi:DUF2325 domain-containing protein [Azospirillum sp. 11R-A]|uniref:DUF2325 domain-containing protein n=1 Tax=Azospirillum sp. 11R-A TaxID=3111634 RepID=UPI003C1F000B